MGEHRTAGGKPSPNHTGPCLLNLRDRFCPTGQLGANEEFQAGDEMIRTVGRLFSLRCGRQPVGKLESRGREMEKKKSLNHSVHIGMKEAEH